MNNKKYKIAIIGAGTIGLYLGNKLKKEGHNVTIFEKRDKIGTDICSGIFSEKIFDFVPEAKAIVKGEIKSVVLNFPKKKIELNFKKKFFLFSHTELDELMFSNLKENVIFNKEVLSIPSNFDKIIGCDGASSFLRNSLKIKKPEFRVGMRGFLKQEDNSKIVQTWPLKNGFIWKIPRGKNVEYGIMEKPEVAKKTLDNFLKKNKIKLENLGARIIPSGFSMNKNKNITICGDATGITKPWSGGGVIWGMKSADILCSNIDNLNFYTKKISKFKFKIFLYKLLTKVIYYTGKNIPFIIPKKVKIDPDFLITLNKE